MILDWLYRTAKIFRDLFDPMEDRGFIERGKMPKKSGNAAERHRSKPPKSPEDNWLEPCFNIKKKRKIFNHKSKNNY